MNAKEFVSTLVIWLFLTPVGAQVIDHFDDNEFATDPAWQGTDNKFVVSGGRLKLQAPPSSGSAFLATPSEAIHQASWSFSLQLDFTPSSTNYTKIYLVADHADLNGPQNGYFIKVGNTTREVSLYRQSGTVETKLIDGVDDRVNQATVVIRLLATRDSTGKWELFSDVGKMGNWTSEGAVTDLTFTESSWFGLACIYTSTRSDKFWFDDFEVTGTKTPDTTPPAFVKLEVLDAFHFQIEFSEPLDSTRIRAEGVTIGTMGHPMAVGLLENQKTIECTLGSPLTNGVLYTVALSGFSDYQGNVISPITVPLMYFNPGTATWKSVLITEFLPDPTPQVGLPAAEFVEIFNATQEPFDLSGWSLTDGTSIGKFPASVFLPGEYRIVTSSSSAALFNSSNVLGLTNFPSLNNSGDHLILYNDAQVLIDSVRYTVDWFQDEDKGQGGWTLELIDPTNPCGVEDNWAASESPNGGTPGMVNSVLASKPDLTGPLVLSLRVVSDQRVSLFFNEALSITSIDEVETEIRPTLSISSVSIPDAARRQLTIDLAESILPRTSYSLALKGVRDCNGNRMDPADLSFGLPEPATGLDIQISEVLFNPRSGGVDFVEIVNTSEKFIELEGTSLGNGETAYSLPGALLKPGHRMAITPNPDILRSQYPQSEAGLLMEASLPSLPDDEGIIQFLSAEGNPLDELHYDHQWHSSLLKNEEGVSLERIDIHAPTQNRENWMSASSRAGFATPGLTNSQERKDGLSSLDEVFVYPEIFSPGEYVQIHYQLDSPGKIVNIEVFNYYGQLIKAIANNELLGMQGFFRWDGDRDDGRQATMGYYVVRVEIFDESGYVNTHFKRVVVAKR